MAGLLTFPQFTSPSQPSIWPVAFEKQTLYSRGLQLQVQFRILTGFPFISSGASHPITIKKSPQKYYYFFTTTKKNAKLF